jgi:hypothetical protein
VSIHSVIQKLFTQLNHDENDGGLLSRETHRVAGELRQALGRFPFEPGERVRKVTGDYRIDGQVIAVFRLFPEQEESPIRVAVRHAADEGFFVHIYAPSNLESIDRTVSK